jgi:glutaredoxin
LIKHLLIFTVFFFIFWGTAQAEFYKWEDESGNIHITDYPPAAKSGKKIQVHTYDSSVREEEQGLSKNGKQNEPDYVLYTRNSCDDCDKAREFLKSKNIVFQEYNTDTNKEAARKRKTIDDSDDVPFAIFNKSHIYGFSESVYKKILKIRP